jgi:hypothetical protein
MKVKYTAVVFGLLLTTPAWAQSTEASQASAISLAPSVELAAAALQAVPAGSALVVRALKPIGKTVELVVEASATGASFVLEVSAETVSALALAAGTLLTVTALSTGYLISAGAEAIAFIPDQLSRSLIHHRELVANDNRQ